MSTSQEEMIPMKNLTPHKRKHTKIKKSSISSIENLTNASSSIMTDNWDNISVASSQNWDSKSQDQNKSFQSKVRQRFNMVRERSSFSLQKVNLNRDKLSMESVRKESSNVNSDVEYLRNRFENAVEKAKRLDMERFFCSQGNQDNETPSENIEFRYSLPKQRASELKESEETLFYKYKKETNEEETENPKDNGLFVMKEKHKNMRKLFEEGVKMEVFQNPLTNTSCRPSYQNLNKDCTQYVPPSVHNGCSEIVSIRENILKLKIFNLKFRHHPLFSTEHIFERRLIELHGKYQIYSVNKNLYRICNKLEALRSVKRNIENNQTQKSDSLIKINKYDNEISELRNLMFKEGEEERNILKSILDTWNIIKKIREKCGYSNTKCKLVIRREKVEYENDREIFAKSFKASLDEIIKETRKTYTEKRENRIEEETDSDEDKKSSSLVVDEKKIKTELKKQFDKSFRAPGEPILHFELAEDHEVSLSTENQKENLRRNAVLSTKIFLRIICNKIDVCKSTPVNLDNSFNCVFNETVMIQLNRIPKSITIELVEQPRSLLRRSISEVEVPLMRQTKTSVKTINFSKSEIIHYKHEGVGCGLNISDISKQFNSLTECNSILSTCGDLNYYLKWNFQANNDFARNIEQSNKLDEILDKNGTVDLVNLKTWLEENADPQDPKNSVLYEYTRGLDANLSNTQNYFRLNSTLNPDCFSRIKNLDDNARLKISQLRNQGELETSDMSRKERKLAAIVLGNREIELDGSELFKHDKGDKGDKGDNESARWNIRMQDIWLFNKEMLVDYFTALELNASQNIAK